MNKLVLLTVIASVLLSGCFRIQYQRSITPEIDRIDKVIFTEGDPKNDSLTHPVRNTYYSSFTAKGKERLKREEKIVSDELTDAYKDVSLETIKQEFIDIQSPCEEISATHLTCVYRILGYIDRRPPFTRNFVKVNLEFQRTENHTVVSFIAYRCYEGKGDCYSRLDETAIALDVINYYKKLKPKALIYDLGRTKEFYQKSITPGIDSIDRVIFLEHIGFSHKHNLLSRHVRNLQPNDLLIEPFRNREAKERDFKDREKRVSNNLTDVYRNVSLEAIKQEFINIQSPCEEIAATHLQCEYKILGYVGENPPFTRDFVKVILDFEMKENQTAVRFTAFRCYEDSVNCRSFRETRDLALEVVNYFKQLKPKALIGDLGDMTAYTEADK